MGLPGGLAVSVATLIVPILLQGVTKKVLKNASVQDWLTKLSNRQHFYDLEFFKNYFKKDSGAEAA